MSSELTLILLLSLAGFGLILIALFLLINKRPPQKVEGLYFASLQGPIYYELYGKKGPFVLLIHGLGSSTYSWRYIAPELAKKYRVITLDLWGFGNSSKNLNNPMTLDSQTEVIKALLDSLNVEKFHLIGHSMGGQIALWLAMNDKRVDRCIAIAPAAYPELISDFLTKITWVAHWTPLLITPKFIRRLLSGLMNDPSYITEEMVEAYFAPYRDRRAHHCFAAALEIIKDDRVYSQLPEFKGPLSLIWGADDKVITSKMRQKITTRAFMSKSITHPKSGHLPMEDDHLWLAQQIISLLKS